MDKPHTCLLSNIGSGDRVEGKSCGGLNLKTYNNLL